MPQSQSSLIDALNQRVNAIARSTSQVASASDRVNHSWLTFSGLMSSAGRGVASLASKFMNLEQLSKSFRLAVEHGPGLSAIFRQELDDIDAQLAAYQDLAERYTWRADQLDQQARRASTAAMADNLRREAALFTARVRTLNTASRDLAESRQLVAVEQFRFQQATKLLDARNKLTAIMAVESSLVLLAISQYNRLNLALTNTNSQLATRRGLIADTLRAQVATGNETEDTAAAARQLAEYGQDLSGSFYQQVVLVSRLEEGLGVAVEHGAQLSFYFGDRLRQSAEQVAGLISTIVNKTALSASKAAEYAINLGKAANIMRLGAGAPTTALNLTKFVLDLEAASQAVTGTSGDFQALVDRMSSSITGLQQARVLGLAGVESLKSPQGLGGLVTRLDQLASELDQLDDTSRVVRLEQLSQVTGLTVATLANLRPILERNRQYQTETASMQSSLEQRWREQVTVSGKALDRLWAAFRALVSAGLAPVLGVAAQVATFVTKIITDLSENAVAFKVATGVVTTAFVAGGVAAATQLWNVVAAFTAMTAAANRATRSMLANALAQTTQGSQATGWFSKLLAGGVAAAAGKLWAVLTAPIGLAAAGVIGVLAGLGVMLYQLHRLTKLNQEIEAEKRRGISQEIKDRLIATSLERSAARLRQQQYSGVADYMIKRTKAASPLPDEFEEESGRFGMGFGESLRNWFSGVTGGGWWNPDQDGWEVPLAKKASNPLAELKYANRLVEHHQAVLADLTAQEAQLVQFARAFEQKVAVSGRDAAAEARWTELVAANKQLLAEITKSRKELEAANELAKSAEQRLHQLEDERERRQQLRPSPSVGYGSMFVPVR